MLDVVSSVTNKLGYVINAVMLKCLKILEKLLSKKEKKRDFSLKIYFAPLRE